MAQIFKNSIIDSAPMEFLNLRNNCLYKTKTGTYLILDKNFVIEKAYNFFISSLWFKYIKPNQGNAKHFFSIIGRFYESYISTILNNSFSHLKHPPIKVLKELEVNFKGKKELFDFYIRQNKKLILGEIKSSSYANKQKYSENKVEEFQISKDSLSARFGIGQIVNSVSNFILNYFIFDKKLKSNKKYKIFPVIVFHDNFFRVPLSNWIFNDIFFNLLSQRSKPINGDVENANFLDYIIFEVHPLTIVHTTSVEIMEPHLTKKLYTIWDVLKENRKNELRLPIDNIVLSKVSLDYPKYHLSKIVKESNIFESNGIGK